MQIILYRIDCEARELAKGWYIENATSKLTLDGTLREQCSIIAPSIAFGRTILALHNYNYAYIKDFDRYYFIADMTTIRDSLTRIDFRCDVLYSFRSNLTSSSSRLFCERWSGSENLITDNLRDYDCHRQVTENPITDYSIAGASVENWSTYIYGVNFVVTFLSNDSIANSDLETYETPPVVQNVIRGTTRNLVEPSYHLVNLVTTYIGLNTLLKEVIKDENKSKAIVAIRSYPFDCIANSSTATRVNSLSYGEYTFDLSAQTWFIAEPMYHILANFRLPHESDSLMARDYENEYKLFLPFDKWITLDLSTIGKDIIMVFYQPIYTYGQCNVYVVDYTAHKLIYSNCVSVCSESSATYSNAQSIKDNYTSTLISGGVSLVGGAIMTGVSVATGNALGATMGITAMGTSIATTGAKLTSTALTSHETLSGSVPNGNSGMLNCKVPRLRWVCKIPVVNENDTDKWNYYKETFGLPYMTTISGDFLTNTEHMGSYFFGECRIPFADASRSEIEELKSILKQGITISKAYS